MQLLCGVDKLRMPRHKVYSDLVSNQRQGAHAILTNMIVADDGQQYGHIRLCPLTPL